MILPPTLMVRLPPFWMRTLAKFVPVAVVTFLVAALAGVSKVLIVGDVEELAAKLELQPAP